MSVEIHGNGWVYAQSSETNSALQNADSLLIAGGFEDYYNSDADEDGDDNNINLRRFLEWQVDGYNGSVANPSTASENPDLYIQK